MAASLASQKEIVRLYTKGGYSMMQIAQLLGCSVSVVRYWLVRNNIDRRSISESITQINITKFHKQPFRVRQSLSKSDEQLKVAGVMLYWGEGAKTGSTVKFVNSDPDMMRLFVHFLVRICGISQERLKALLHLYPDQNEEDLKEFWSHATGIPVTQFYKSHVHAAIGGTYKNKSQYGTLAVNYSDKKLLALLLEWIEQYTASLS